MGASVHLCVWYLLYPGSSPVNSERGQGFSLSQPPVECVDVSGDPSNWDPLYSLRLVKMGKSSCQKEVNYNPQGLFAAIDTLRENTSPRLGSVLFIYLPCLSAVYPLVWAFPWIWQRGFRHHLCGWLGGLPLWYPVDSWLGWFLVRPEVVLGLTRRLQYGDPSSLLPLSHSNPVMLLSTSLPVCPVLPMTPRLCVSGEERLSVCSLCSTQLWPEHVSNSFPFGTQA